MGSNVATNTFLFTSESVGEGHPDKICDLISDAIVDACVEQDPMSKLAVETAIKPGEVYLFGVIVTHASIDYEAVVRRTLQDIGYDSPDQPIQHDTAVVFNNIEVHVSAAKTDEGLKDMYGNIGAGDQGLVFGYATDETESFLPLTTELAHKLVRTLKEARGCGMPWMRPDTKAQVTVEYEQNGGQVLPLRVHTVVVSVAHGPGVDLDALRSEIRDKIIPQAIPARFLDKNTILLIQPSGGDGVQPSGKFVGLTGRKVVVDTYGGWGAHGGGAFSGKDFRQVDRSAAYCARWAAKSLVAAGLARRCLVQISYAIGHPRPVSVYVDSYGTGTVGPDRLAQLVMANFDMRPWAIAVQLGLTRPRYYETAKNGHFTDQAFLWEAPKELVL